MQSHLAQQFMFDSALEMKTYLPFFCQVCFLVISICCFCQCFWIIYVNKRHHQSVTTGGTGTSDFDKAGGFSCQRSESLDSSWNTLKMSDTTRHQLHSIGVCVDVNVSFRIGMQLCNADVCCIYWYCCFLWLYVCACWKMRIDEEGSWLQCSLFDLWPALHNPSSRLDRSIPDDAPCWPIDSWWDKWLFTMQLFGPWGFSSFVPVEVEQSPVALTSCLRNVKPWC